MKKALLVIAVVALLGVLAAYVNPLGPEKHTLGGVASVKTVTPTSVSGESEDDAPAVAAPVTAPATAATASYKDGTFQGSDYTSQYGDVQVSVTIQNGKITTVQFDQLTAYDGHSREINNYAAPQLRSQTLATQSAQIDGVSGATFTSSSYEQSLQSALDKARA